MKLTGTKAGKPMKIVVNKDGKTSVVVDHRAELAKLSISTRIAKQASKKVRVVKRGGK